MSPTCRGVPHNFSRVPGVNANYGRVLLSLPQDVYCMYVGIFSRVLDNAITEFSWLEMQVLLQRALFYTYM